MNSSPNQPGFNTLPTSLVLAVCAPLLLVFSGCAAFFAPVSPIPVTPEMPLTGSEVPRELNKVTHAPYVIEPPDILLIDVVRMVPLPPHRLQPLDVLAIRAAGSLNEEPIAGLYQIDETGRVELGLNYGSIEVVDLTAEEARSTIENHLRRVSGLEDPQVSVSLASSAIAQTVSGQHIVRSDGQISLGLYGSVYIAGQTVDQARATIEQHLSQYLLKPQVVVEILAFNSKKYWIITEGAGIGDSVASRPLVGDETVIDALATIGGVSRLSNEKMYIARPAPAGDCEQILEVNWEDIKHGLTATNYQMMPGDRLIVEEDPLISFDNWASKLTRPWERAFGFTLLGAQAIQRLESFGNDGRNNN
jgi:protein involved in polysaccharide export with SLBB domain